jgi:hypothetical protein
MSDTAVSLPIRRPPVAITAKAMPTIIIIQIISPGDSFGQCKGSDRRRGPGHQQGVEDVGGNEITDGDGLAHGVIRGIPHLLSRPGVPRDRGGMGKSQDERRQQAVRSVT